jgi:hypothetical protein
LKFAFNFNLRRYTWVLAAVVTAMHPGDRSTGSKAGPK